MNSNTKHIDNLIAKYLAGEITPEERVRLTSWLENAPDHEKYFDDIRFIHDKAVASHKYRQVDAKKAWDLLQQKMEEPPRQINAPAPQINWFRKSWMGIAAAVIVILGLSVFLMVYRTGHSKIVQTAAVTSADDIIEKVIDKDFQVVLNRHSHIRYTATRRKRQVELTGEAYFKVQHSEQSPLLVEAEGTLIEDIGTSFNVKAMPGEDFVEVSVDTGAVRFFTPTHQGILLHAGETGHYQKSSGVFSLVENPDLNATAYKTKQFVFRNARLAEVTDALSAVYDVPIVLENPQLADCTISVSFNREEISYIMEIIAETLNLTLETTHPGFVLKGEQCNHE